MLPEGIRNASIRNVRRTRKMTIAIASDLIHSLGVAPRFDRSGRGQVIKNDGAQPCDNADEYKIYGPFAGKSDIDGRLFVGNGWDNLFKTA